MQMRPTRSGDDKWTRFSCHWEHVFQEFIGV